MDDRKSLSGPPGLARSLRLEAVISMVGGCQMGLWGSSAQHFGMRGGPRTLKCPVHRVGGRAMRAPSAQLTTPRVASFPQTPVRGRSRGMGHRARVQSPARRARAGRGSIDLRNGVNNGGFRVASVPEPSTGLLVVLGLSGLLLKRRKTGTL